MLQIALASQSTLINVIVSTVSLHNQINYYVRSHNWLTLVARIRNVVTTVPYRHARDKGERSYSSSFLTSTLDGVSGQRHAPVALYPWGNDLQLLVG
jgi:hypothetical protein